MKSKPHDIVLEVKGISKNFPGVKALDNVSMELYAGKVTAVIGENGAGKSTLMKILSGIFKDYQGQVLLHGKPRRFATPREAQDAGIAIIHQELNLVPHLSIRENIYLGRELVNRFGFLNIREMRKRTNEMLVRLKQEINPETLISSLKVGQQQIIEIAKALMFDASVIIMDEPTSAISDSEVDVLFDIIEELKKEGKTIAYISHKLDELSRISDRYIVLRDGKLIDSGEMAGITKNEIIKKMVGRELQLVNKSGDETSGQNCFEARHITLRHPDLPVVKLVSDINFSLKQGEILGIFGLMGAGRTELLETLYGLHPNRSEGQILVDGKPCKISSPFLAIKSGLGLVPEDRKSNGLILGLDVKTNISLANIDRIEKNGILSHKLEKALALEYIDRLEIKTPSERQKARNLSGGNQQKIILAKWLATKPRVLLMDEPTRGIDIHSKNEIYKLMIRLAADGLGIIMVSSELPEILAIADRIMVMSEGRLTAEFNAVGASEEQIMEAAILQTV